MQARYPARRYQLTGFPVQGRSVSRVLQACLPRLAAPAGEGRVWCFLEQQQPADIHPGKDQDDQQYGLGTHRCGTKPVGAGDERGLGRMLSGGGTSSAGRNPRCSACGAGR
jgi:hypothetical protein